ncbi:MAG TPA: glycosyltransferase family 1 protein [Burkholderiaceae bacterium]|jgi:glycosyltransferase involved in cell wall biosynthesis
MKPTSDASFLVENLPASSRSLRVACVTETYPPEVNGVAITLARIVAGLHQRHHDVQLIRPRRDALDVAGGTMRFNEVLMRGMPIPNYPDLKMGMPAKPALIRLWTLQRPDVVHIATEGPLGWSALQAAIKLRLPVTSDFRTNFHAYSKHYGAGWLRRPIVAYLRKFHNRTHFTMVPTEALKRELAAEGFQRLSVVARGVDTSRFSPARRDAALRESWGVQADDLVMLYVGRLAAEKNLQTLVTAYAAVRAIDARAKLVVVGDGPMRKTLEERCPGAVFAGQRRDDDLLVHYASADLFVFPSLTETFGNSTIEAMASGLPVVAFDHAAASQLIEPGVHGLLAPYADDAAFVEHVRALAADAALRRAMSVQARARVMGLDWREVVGQFESMLVQAVRQVQIEGVSGALPLRATV